MIVLPLDWIAGLSGTSLLWHFRKPKASIFIIQRRKHGGDSHQNFVVWIIFHYIFFCSYVASLWHVVHIHMPEAECECSLSVHCYSRHLLFLFQLSKDRYLGFIKFTNTMSRMGYGWTAHIVQSIERPRLAIETPWIYSWICPYLAVNIGKSFHLHGP